MNWDKVKEKFPNCYPRLLELHQKTKWDGEFLLRGFCADHNEYAGIRPIYGLREIEKKLNEAGPQNDR